MKKKYISPSTVMTLVQAEPLLNPATGVPNQDQDDDGGRAKGNGFADENNYWDNKTKNLWED